MAMFTGYVSLPEGVYIYIYSYIVVFLLQRKTHMFDQRFVVPRPPKLSFQKCRVVEAGLPNDHLLRYFGWS